MKLRKDYMTKCKPYTDNKKITVKKLVLHSTGTAQPKIAAYIPAENKPDCAAAVHAFIGIDEDGELGIVQTLPFDVKGWHVGSGSKGSYNSLGPGVEICEPCAMAGYDAKKASNVKYFNEVKELAIELFGTLCIKYKLNPLDDIEDHASVHALGYGSNHGDIKHWWDIKHGYSLQDFRKDVKAWISAEKKVDAAKALKVEAAKVKAATPVKLSYTKGVYTVTAASLNVRTGPGSTYPKIPMKKITAVLKKSGGYVKGTKFTAISVTNSTNHAWAKTSLGYMCIQLKGKIYCKK